MPINPCGAACDWGRDPGVIRTRFFRGSDIEVEQRWYVADHDARDIPYPSAFMRSIWYDNELEIDAVRTPPLGEQFETWSRRSTLGGPQGHTGAHVCGNPEWYKTGVPVDPARPPVRYGTDGVPVCCAPGRGIMWGSPVPLPAGGVEWGGVAELADGGLLWASVPASPPHSAAYVSTLTSFPFNVMSESAPGSDYYLGSIINMKGPLVTGVPGYWTLNNVFTDVVVFETHAWDGTGSRVFTRVFAGTPPTTTVSVWP